MELQNLQQQLKLAIQSHQILVSKMKADPQNTILQRQLHELQAEIMALSDKQKQVVQQLRKEIEIKQHQTNVNSYSPHHFQRDSNHEPITVQTTPLPLVKTSEIISMKSLPVVTPATLACKVTSDQNKIVSVSSPLLVPKSDTTGVINNSCTALNLTPAIRVPQYPPPCLRPNQSQPQLRFSSLSPPAPITRSTSRQSTAEALKEAEVIKLNKTESSNVNNNEVFQKVDFMAALGLITHDTLSELQNRRSERKRRTTANPQFSYGNWDLSDKKRKANNYLTSPLPLNFRKPRGRPRLGSTPNNSCPATPDDGSSNRESPNGPNIQSGMKNGTAEFDEVCSVCQSVSNDLLHCDTCMLSYHRNCLDTSPFDSHVGNWICPKCQLMKKTPTHWPGSLAMVHSYIAHRAAKEEEKRKLIKRSLELKSEHSQLEQKAKQLTETIALQMHKRNEMFLHTQQTQESIDVLKKFIKHFQDS